MSAEPGRKRAYSTDIQLRVVYQRIGMGLRFCEIAANLNITTSTAFQNFKQFEISGDIGIPEARKSRQELRSLDEHSELIVIGLLLQTPTLYLHEICHTIQEVTSISVSQATICRLLKRYGFSRKLSR
jgi:transposase